MRSSASAHTVYTLNLAWAAGADTASGAGVAAAAMAAAEQAAAAARAALAVGNYAAARCHGCRVTVLC